MDRTSNRSDFVSAPSDKHRMRLRQSTAFGCSVQNASSCSLARPNASYKAVSPAVVARSTDFLKRSKFGTMGHATVASVPMERGRH